MKFKRIVKAVVFSLLLVVTVTSESRAQTWFNLRHGSDALNANMWILSICSDAADNIYAAGEFRDTPTVDGKRYVAKWDATRLSWDTLGTGSNALNANAAIRSLCTDRAGNAFAAGTFSNGATMTDGYHYVAKWDGTHWSELGSGSSALNANNPISTICADRSGAIYAAGNFTDTRGYLFVGKWNGTRWVSVGTLNANDNINAICVDDSFNVYAAGNFTDSNGYAYVAKYEYATGIWRELGTGFDSVGQEVVINSLFTDTFNQVVAAVNCRPRASSSTTSNVFRWNGSSWGQLGTLNGNDYLQAVCKGDSGFVFATGDITNSAGVNYVAKYDPAGNCWSELGPTTNPFGTHSPSVYDHLCGICTDSHGNVYAAGSIRDSISSIDDFYFVAKYGRYQLEVGSPDIKVSFQIFPNPVSDQLEVNFKSFDVNRKFMLYSENGREYREGSLCNVRNMIPVSDLVPGTYIIRLNVDGTTVNYKLIKQ